MQVACGIPTESHAHHRHLQSSKNHTEEYEKDSLSMKSAYSHVLSDTLGAVGVIAAGVIILATRFFMADPLISIGLAVFIFKYKGTHRKIDSHSDGRCSIECISQRGKKCHFEDKGCDRSIRSAYMDDNFWY